MWRDAGVRTDLVERAGDTSGLPNKSIQLVFILQQQSKELSSASIFELNQSDQSEMRTFQLDRLLFFYQGFWNCCPREAEKYLTCRQLGAAMLLMATIFGAIKIGRDWRANYEPCDTLAKWKPAALCAMCTAFSQVNNILLTQLQLDQIDFHLVAQLCPKESVF